MAGYREVAISHGQDHEFVDRPAMTQEGATPLVGGAELERLLGYRTSSAFRQAVHRKTIPIPVFSLKHRRGKFAFRKDVFTWLDELRGRLESVQA